MSRCEDPPLPRVVNRATARTAGLTDRQVTYRVTSGHWRLLRRGVFLTVADQVAGAADLAEVELLAAASSTRRDLVVSHNHAARLWGLPQPLGGWGVPTFLADRGPDRTRRSLIIRASPFEEGEVVTLGSGLRVTGPARTVLDCLRTLSPANGLAIADAAARRLISADTLRIAAGAFDGWPGIRQARRLLTLVDGRRETPLESWSAVAFDDEKLPRPTWQVDIGDASGFIGRADAWWAAGVVGEADGRAKYRLRAEELGGADASRLAEVLADERAREQRLTRTGAEVVRWGADDVLGGRRKVALGCHLRAVLAKRDRGRRFTGSAHPAAAILP